MCVGSIPIGRSKGDIMLKAIVAFIGLLSILFPILCAVAWVTHVVFSIMAGSYILLAIGAIVFPIGIIHGVMIWFGLPWGG